MQAELKCWNFSGLWEVQELELSAVMGDTGGLKALHGSFCIWPCGETAFEPLLLSEKGLRLEINISH